MEHQQGANMASDCKECELNLQQMKERVNYTQMNSVQKQAYWETFRKLAQNTDRNAQEGGKIDQG